MIRWYALYVRSRWEKKVDRELSRKFVESFLPTVCEKHRWSDRTKVVEEPLFRGYVFVRLDLRNRLGILETDGVVSIVGIRGKPSPIPEEQIEWLRILVKHPDSIHREPKSIVGAKVKITTGPFNGIEGTVIMAKGSTRIAVSIDAIQQSIIVDVSGDSIEPVEGVDN